MRTHFGTHLGTHGALFILGLAVFSTVAWDRLGQQSADPHFVYQADAWLNGRLHTKTMPPGSDDPARVEVVALRDGGTARGRRLRSRPFFRTTKGLEIPLAEVERTVETIEYCSFPPVPALLMVPQVAISGTRANDVVLTVFVAALLLPLMFSVLLLLGESGDSTRTRGENLWLTMLFGFGTVLFFSAVQGRVWFTAHVIGVFFALLYVRFSLAARRPILAGFALGLAALTRTPMAFMFPLFLFQAWNVYQNDRKQDNNAETSLRKLLITIVKFSTPIIILAGLAIAHNIARFDQATEFGHSYLAVRQQAQIEAHGLFSSDYFGRNLTVLLTLLPQLGDQNAWVKISGHGLAIWVTTPALLLLLWPKQKPALARHLWISVALVAIPTLFYQNSGWVQFGYRFALDYIVLLIALLAIGGRPLNRGFKTLIIISILINLFGAITFGRYPQYYQTDNRTYSAIIRN